MGLEPGVLGPWPLDHSRMVGVGLGGGLAGMSLVEVSQGGEVSKE